jgi:hypothetical protein
MKGRQFSSIFYLISVVGLNAVLLSVVSPARCQTNFVEGYYITSSKDTTHGFIEYNSDQKNGKVCRYKADLRSKPVTLYPNDIEGYVLMNRAYFEKHQFSDVEGNNTIGFFKVLVRGKLSLLAFESKSFVKDSQGKLFDISRKRETTSQRVALVPRGVAILKELMQDCLDVYYNLDDDFQEEADLPGIFRKYNLCAQDFAFEAREIEMRKVVSCGISGSSSMASLAFHGMWGQATFQDQFSPQVGGYASLFIPRMNENFRVVGEMLYGQDKRYGFFKFDQSNNDLFINYSYLRIPVYVEVPIKKIFLTAGSQWLMIMNQNFRWRQESPTQGVIITTEKAVEKIQGVSQGFVVGVGKKWNFSRFHLAPSIRFSRNSNGRHSYQPVFRYIEFNLHLGLNGK